MPCIISSYRIISPVRSPPCRAPSSGKCEMLAQVCRVCAGKLRRLWGRRQDHEVGGTGAHTVRCNGISVLTSFLYIYTRWRLGRGMGMGGESAMHTAREGVRHGAATGADVGGCIWGTDQY